MLPILLIEYCIMELVKHKSFQKRIMIYDRKFNLTYIIFKEKQKKKEGNLEDRQDAHYF